MMWYWLCDRCEEWFEAETIERHCDSCRVHGPLLCEMSGE